MEVNRHQFKAIYPRIRDIIRQADFIAIDTEFTGLNYNATDKTNLFDSPKERFCKLRRTVKKFIPCQLGLACFRKNPDFNKYEVRVFTIPLYPRTFGAQGTVFCCHSSALDFLARNQFDFNKFVRDGVSFLNEEQEALMRNQLLRGSYDNNDMDRKNVENLCGAASTWAEAAEIGTEIEYKTEETGLRRDLLCFEVTKLVRGVFAQPCPSSEHQVVLKRVEDQGSGNAAALLDSVMDELIGCTKLFRDLAAMKKPVVGHNLLMDMLYLYHWMHKPLPESYDKWKADLHSFLPLIFDTKYAALSLRKELLQVGIEGTSLASLYSALHHVPQQMYASMGSTDFLFAHQPYVEFVDDAKRYELEGWAHEAGFDALMTGVVFLRFAHIFALKDQDESCSWDWQPVVRWADHLDAVRPIANLLNLIQAAAPYLDLAAADPPAFRPDWLLFQSTAKIDLEQLTAQLSKYGSVDVKLMDSRRALVATATVASLENIVDEFRSSNTYTVCRYSEFRPSSFYTTPVIWGSALLSATLATVAFFVVSNGKSH